ncbi:MULTISPECIES: HpcH/HpaI aldolase/citrate lyase family protein [unclassified Salipiger]|uniref:HpcH/HpaI aldolase family protein n=1 Tax=unclassified Salipiger TaxID=2640570 RepID=UPI0013B884E0|nr:MULTISPECIES: aldolase/citrate lyase family protein [unclassified Salipiger]NDV52233.1 aldolase [Salipiger sp. PrR003]NDW31855.1 aldolase [Salipiger sp. PrR007]
MTGKNKLKARLQAGETVTAAWLEFGTPEVAELLVHTGWDVVVIDCEHGTAGLEEGLGLIRAVEAAGGQAIVRVPDCSEATLKRALDRGARSLMVPMVSSAAMARDIAAFCQYSPRGRRGYAAPIVRASDYGKRTDYAKTAHDELLIMAQIEHVDTVREVAEIAGIEGIDMAFVGPNDFAASMDHLEDMTHPDVQGQIAEVEKVARAGGLMLGTIVGAGRSYADLREAGYSFIVGPNDISLLAAASRAARAESEMNLGCRGS